MLSTLSPDEALALSEAVGPELAVLGSCIARLYVCNPAPTATKQVADSAINRFPGIRKGRWMGTHVRGALALVMHRPTSSLYFMMFNHRSWVLLFDYELYYDLEYKELSDHFHCFEMDDLMAGFCIASAVTAKAFFVKVKMMAPKQGVSVGKLLGSGVEKAAAKQAKQAGAGAPVVRVGADGSIVTDAMWLPDGTLNVDNIPQAWKKLLKSAGFSKGDLRDPGMKLLIVACLEDCGISAQAPPRDLTEDEQAAFYSPDERRRYEQYKRDMHEYEAAMKKYNEEMRAYEAWEREQTGLAQWAAAMAEQHATQHTAQHAEQHAEQDLEQQQQQRRRSLSSRLSDTFLGPAPPKPARTGDIALQQQQAAATPRGAAKGPPPPMPPRDLTPPRPKRPDRISVAPQLPALPVIPLEVLKEHEAGRDVAGEGPQEALEGHQDAHATPAPTPAPAPAPTPPRNKRTTFFGLIKQKAPALRPPSTRDDKSAPQTAGAALRPKSRAFVAELRDKGAGAHLKKPALPDLGSVDESMVDKLRQRLAERRGVIHVEADDDWGNLDE